MDEIRVMQILFEDISRLELPPISEKVLVAIREKKQKIAKNSLIYSVTEKEHKSFPTKYLFAAMLTLLAVSVPIIVVLTHKASVSNAPNCPVLPNSNETVSTLESQVVSMANNETTLDRIKLKQIYGEVALSGKSEEELEMLLVTYSKENSVYEDEQYIYNFDSHGRLLEMRKADFGDEEGQPVDEQAISVKVNALLKEYYSDWSENEYDIRIEKNEGSRPAWTVYIIKNNDDLSKVVLTATFDKSGILQGIIRDGSINNAVGISKAEAVEIALQELNSGKYNIMEFRPSDVDIIVEVRNRSNKQYYFVAVDSIPMNREMTMGFYFEINSNSGEIICIKN